VAAIIMPQPFKATSWLQGLHKDRVTHLKSANDNKEICPDSKFKINFFCVVFIPTVVKNVALFSL
jgi:hypothetical protein